MKGRRKVYGVENCKAQFNHGARTPSHRSVILLCLVRPLLVWWPWMNYYTDVRQTAANGDLGVQRQGWQAPNQADWKNPLNARPVALHQPTNLFFFFKQTNPQPLHRWLSVWSVKIKVWSRNLKWELPGLILSILASAKVNCSQKWY